MSVLHRFEQRLETAVSGAFARVFRSAVQPVEIAAALQREVDSSAQIVSRDRRLAPNAFAVDLSPSDYARLSPYGGTLSAELGQMVREHVDEQRYVLAGPLSIAFAEQDDLTTGRFRVRSRAHAEVAAAAAMSDTAALRAPVVVEVGGRSHPIDVPGAVVGRGGEADIRINDPGVSRKHLEIRVEVDSDRVSVWAIDLGSTNGTSVDGQRIQRQRLRDGSRVRVGNTTLVVHDPHSAPAGRRSSGEP